MSTVTQDPRVLFAKDHPEMSQSAISRHFGLSRERIRQVFEVAGYTHPRPSQKIPRVSRVCGQPDCQTSFQARAKESTVNCPAHRGKLVKRFPRVQVTCDSCGKVAPRRATLIKEGQKLTFCDNKCQGRWLGRQNKR